VKTEILIPASAPGPVFIQKSDSRSSFGFGKNRRLLPESTPALRLRDYLWPGSSPIQVQSNAHLWLLVLLLTLFLCLKHWSATVVKIRR